MIYVNEGIEKLFKTFQGKKSPRSFQYYYSLENIYVEKKRGCIMHSTHFAKKQARKCAKMVMKPRPSSTFGILHFQFCRKRLQNRWRTVKILKAFSPKMHFLKNQKSRNKLLLLYFLGTQRILTILVECRFFLRIVIPNFLLCTRLYMMIYFPRC